MTSLVDALSAVADADVGFVLVGGLAVMARLAAVHRATSDLDALSGDDLFVVTCESRIPQASLVDHKLVVGEVKVDAIIVDGEVSYPSIAEAVDAPIDRLFTAGHRFALDDAGPVDIVVGDHRTRVRVATARALLVTKLHAYLSPRRDQAKGGSDALDLVRLGEVLARADGPSRLEASQLPALVTEVAGWALREVAADPGRLRRRLRSVDAPPSSPMLIDLLLDDLGPP